MASSKADLIAAIEKKVVVHGRYNINLQIAYGSINVQFVANQEKVIFINYENNFVFSNGCFIVIPVLYGTASEKYEVSIQSSYNNGFNLMYNCQGVTNGALLEVRYIAFGF